MRIRVGRKHVRFPLGGRNDMKSAHVQRGKKLRNLSLQLSFYFLNWIEDGQLLLLRFISESKWCRVTQKQWNLLRMIEFRWHQHQEFQRIWWGFEVIVLMATCALNEAWKQGLEQVWCVCSKCVVALEWFDEMIVNVPAVRLIGPLWMLITVWAN